MRSGSTPDGFKQYRIYSASYSLDNNQCGTAWTLEGTTVSPEFLASALTNGVSRCFGVSAESIEGWESLWSDVIADTPRPDARNVLIFPFQADPTRSGFRFAGPLALGIVAAGNDPNVDFRVDRDVNGDLWPFNLNPFIFELIGPDGKAIASRIVAVNNIDPQLFQTTLPYKVFVPTTARLTIRQDDDRITGLFYVYSQEVLLNP